MNTVRFANWLAHMQSAVYPSRCVLCEAHGDNGLDLCVHCRADLPRHDNACQRCAALLPTNAAVTLCPACLHHPPPFDSAHAALTYSTPADWLILQLKFHSRLSHARLLGNLLAEQLQVRLQSLPAGERPELILPVPLHKRRMAERGFNQASEIAKPVARVLGLPVMQRLARRQRDTRHQMSLPAAKRRANVHGAFHVSAQLANRRIAIIDDVITTGQTVTALARAARQAGAARIDVWCAARA